MRGTKQQTAVSEGFDKAAGEIASEEYGAEETTIKAPTGNYLRMVTTYGPMTVWPHTRPSKNVLFSVFCRFEDSEHFEAAAKALGSNPFTGKYNFHCSGSEGFEDALRSFRSHLQRVVVE